MFKRIDHVEIVPTDYERAIAFYCDVLGFAIRERVPLDLPYLREIVFLELGDTVLELLDIVDPAPPAVDSSRVGYRMMALEVDSMEDALVYLAGKGIEPSAPPHPTGNGFRAEILDPDGLPIEIRQW